MKLETYIQTLRENIQKGLPGKQAQAKMSVNGDRLRIAPPLNARQAGVMILLYPKKSETYITYILRKTIEKDVHKGQVSFPGGRMEIQDQNDIISTAQRETQEEIGVQVPRNQVIATLTELYIPVSNYLVHPVVGYLEEEPDFIKEEAELEEILETPLPYLENPSIQDRKSITIASGFSIPDVPYYDLQGYTLWGATAMITAEFLALLDLK